MEEQEKWVEVEVNPKTPEPPKDETPVETQEEPPPEEKYGSRAEKRIRQLVAKTKELEERASRAEALAQAKAQEAEKAAQQARGTEDSALSVYAQSLDSKLKTAEKRFQDAYEAADKEALLAAQHELIEAKLEMKALDTWKKGQAQQPQPQPQPQPEEPRARVAPATQSWMQKNPWFGKGDGKDTVATMAAVGISEELIAEGYDPNSEEFYEEVDKRLGDNLPRMRRQEPRNPVAGQARTPSRRIRLDEATVAASRKLGASLEDTARYAEAIKDAGEGYVTIDIKRGRRT